MNDVVGYIAMTLSVLSFTLSKQRFIRLTNLISCIAWVCYGYVINNNPTIIVNVLVCVIHIVWFIRRYRRIVALRSRI
jgi:hypothetical protein